MKEDKSNIGRNYKLAREVIHKLNKEKNEYALYRFIKKLIQYAEESPYEYIIPVFDLPEYIKEEKTPKYKRKYDKNNIGLRFTENCIISNKCSKKCYRYEICRTDYENRMKESNRIEYDNID